MAPCRLVGLLLSHDRLPALVRVLLGRSSSSRRLGLLTLHVVRHSTSGNSLGSLLRLGVGVLLLELSLQLLLLVARGLLLLRVWVVRDKVVQVNRWRLHLGGLLLGRWLRRRGLVLRLTARGRLGLLGLWLLGLWLLLLHRDWLARAAHGLHGRVAHSGRHEGAADGEARNGRLFHEVKQHVGHFGAGRSIWGSVCDLVCVSLWGAELLRAEGQRETRCHTGEYRRRQNNEVRNTATWIAPEQKQANCSEKIA